MSKAFKHWKLRNKCDFFFYQLLVSSPPPQDTVPSYHLQKGRCKLTIHTERTEQLCAAQCTTLIKTMRTNKSWNNNNRDTIHLIGHNGARRATFKTNSQVAHIPHCRNIICNSAHRGFIYISTINWASLV